MSSTALGTLCRWTRRCAPFTSAGPARTTDCGYGRTVCWSGYALRSCWRGSFHRRHARLLGALAAALAVAGGLAACDSRLPQGRASVSAVSHSSGSSQAAGCGRTAVLPSAGAATVLGLNAQGVQAPQWSAPVGSVQAAVSGLVYATTPGACVLALQARSGRQVWSWSRSGHVPLMGLLASSDLVLVATGTIRGHALPMVYATTNRLVGLDPRTGRQRWAVPLADDGQPVPAVIAEEASLWSKPTGWCPASTG